MMLPFPGKAPRELEIIYAPAHGLELFKRLAEIDVVRLFRTFYAGAPAFGESHG